MLIARMAKPHESCLLGSNLNNVKVVNVSAINEKYAEMSEMFMTCINCSKILINVTV